MKNELKKAALRERILEAAKTVFLAKGFAETKIVDIAREAHISPSTIYLYFRGKEELFHLLNIPEVAGLRPEFEQTRVDILRIALTFFGDHGFERTTMDDIAAAVGLSKAALYQYFSNKEDLFLQVLRHYISTGVQTPGSRAGEDWREYLRVVANSCLGLSRTPERKAFLGTVIRDSNKFPAFGEAYYKYSYQVARRSIVGFLTTQQEQGHIRADANLRDITDVYLGTLMSYVVLYRTVGGIDCDVDEKTYIDQLTDVFVRALEA